MGLPLHDGWGWRVEGGGGGARSGGGARGGTRGLRPPAQPVSYLPPAPDPHHSPTPTTRPASHEARPQPHPPCAPGVRLPARRAQQRLPRPLGHAYHGVPPRGKQVVHVGAQPALAAQRKLDLGDEAHVDDARRERRLAGGEWNGCGVGAGWGCGWRGPHLAGRPGGDRGGRWECGFPSSLKSVSHWSDGAAPLTLTLAPVLACRAMNPDCRPMSLTTPTPRKADDASTLAASSARCASSTAVSKPKHLSMSRMSLSIDLGTPMTEHTTPWRSLQREGG